MKIKISDKMSFRKLIIFAIPSIIMFLFMASYQIVDAMFVTNFVSTDALSALNITYPITSLFVAIGVMFGTGGSALVSKMLGEGDKEEAKKAFTLITVTALILTIILAGLCLIFIEPLLYAIGADSDTFQYSKDYLTIILLFSPFFILQILYQSFFVVISKPITGLIFTISSGLANILFDYVFIVLLNLGISGAAYGTVIGFLIPAIGGLIIFIFRKNGLKYSKFKINFKYIYKSMLNGSSEMVINLAVSVTTLIFNLTMMDLAGSEGVAAITAILYVQYLMQAFFIGYSLGVAPVVSYNYGEKREDFIRSIRNKSLIFISIFSLVITIISFFISVPLAKLFSADKKEIYDLIYKGNMIFTINYLFAGLNIYLSSFFTSLNDGITSAIIAFCRTFLFILIFTPICAHFLDTNGVFLVIPIAEFLTFIVAMSLLRFSYIRDITKIIPEFKYSSIKKIKTNANNK